MSANPHAQPDTALADLRQQHSLLQQRQQELEKQQSAVQQELAALGFMQLGKKMVLRAELDSISKRLTANRQQQAALLRQIADLQRPQAMPVPEAAPAPIAAPTAAPVAEPISEPVDTPAAEPAPAAAPAARPSVRKRAPRTPRIVIDPALPPEEQVSRLLTHLEAYYPEHRLFAAEVLPTETRARLTALAGACGHASTAELLAAHGWQQITLAEGRMLRQPACPAPGEEPAALRPRLASLLARLEKHYPDKVIARSIQHGHKSLAQEATALSAHLGYPGVGAMLTAYGFRYEVSAGGRPPMDVAGAIAALKAAYPDGARPRSVTQIISEHPEFSALLKTLQNQAPRRYGMSLRQYLISQGVM